MRSFSRASLIWFVIIVLMMARPQGLFTWNRKKGGAA
jgi:hypothetical protein